MHPLDELKAYRQWVVFTLVDKVPWRADGSQRASPTNPADWVDYQTAAACVAANPGLLGLGFVLAKSDPYTVVDLDTYRCETDAARAEHAAIHDAFDSYSELSPSGKGVHIWLRGHTTAKKLPEKHFEVYSEAHYFTVTFQTLKNSPIQERQETLNKFKAWYWPNENPIVNVENVPLTIEVNTPEEIKKRAEFMNGDKFVRLWEGKEEIWNRKIYPNAEYESHSEADLALCNMLAFPTDNQRLVEKLYLSSPLAQTQEKRFRSKWVKDLVKKSFDRKLPVSPELTAVVQKQWTEVPVAPRVEVVPEVVPELPELPQQWQNPTGLIRSIAGYVYDSALYPTTEVAIAAAITLMAAVCGRAYNTVTGSGLNLYTALLADSGIGKEAAATGISSLTAHVRTQIPEFDKFIGPSDIASPQALLRHLGDEKTGSNSFYTHKGEIGLWLQKMNDKYVKHNEANLKQMLLDVYHKSGNKQVLKGSIYSDNSKNAPLVYAPAFSILGDSTPDEFWPGLDERSMKNGLVSRFSIIECRNKRPIYNPNGNQVQPDPQLVWNVSSLGRFALQANKVNSVLVVLEDEESHSWQLKYQKKCQDKVWADNKSPIASLWNRAHLKVLRLGALSAIGNDPQNPTVHLFDYLWAKDLVEHGIRAINRKYDSGDIGQSSEGDEQRKELAKQLLGFCVNPYNEKWENCYSVNREMHKLHVVSMRYLQARLSKYACFKHSMNYRMALHNALDLLCEAGTLTKIVSDTNSPTGVKALGFKINDTISLKEEVGE